MAEQRDDGRTGAEPGTDLEPTGAAQPAPPAAAPQPPAPQLDPQQLREFEQFKQFQDYLKFTQAQQGNQPAPTPEGGLVPAPSQQPAAYQAAQPPAPVAPQTGLLVPAERSGPRTPRWLRRLGGKLLGWILAFVLLAVAVTWVYHQFFPSDAGKTSAQIAAEGGHTYHATPLLAKNPYEAVRSVYDALGKANPNQQQLMSRACGPMDEATQQKFAQDLGFRDCGEAAVRLSGQVEHARMNDYINSIPRYQSDQPLGEQLTISSCAYPVKGGPSLGSFTVKQVEKGQWLIVGHTNEPTPCPAPAPSTAPPSTR
ncbi:hypothetical protein [Amycolatopsis samaneae]|uniref:Mce-associated membrane protein n=1 Tax=Amycolatopsis samaneae TaxID=664691 RepID=A0ABW5GGP6_9PSEU